MSTASKRRQVVTDGDAIDVVLREFVYVERAARRVTIDIEIKLVEETKNKAYTEALRSTKIGRAMLRLYPGIVANDVTYDFDKSKKRLHFLCFRQIDEYRLDASGRIPISKSLHDKLDAIDKHASALYDERRSLSDSNVLTRKRVFLHEVLRADPKLVSKLRALVEVALVRHAKRKAKP